MNAARPGASVALALWLGASGMASALAGDHPLAGLALAVAGGVTLGWLSARRADPVRVRVGRQRRSPRAVDE